MSDNQQLPFGFEKPEDSPGFLLWQTTITWQRLIKKALDPYGISHAQFVVMAITLWLEGHGYASTQIQLAHWSKLDKMTVSKALKKLAADGLVTRAEHTRDSRAKSVALTPAGRELICKLVPLVEDIDAQFFGVVSVDDQRALIQLLHRLVGELPMV